MRVLAAAAALPCEVGEDWAVADVALRARVSERTVYRHFQTRDALISTVWSDMLERIGVYPASSGVDRLIESPLVMFPGFDDERELLRAYLYSRWRRQRHAVLDIAPSKW